MRVRLVVLLVLVSWLVPALPVAASVAAGAGQGCGDNTMPMYDCRMQERPVTAWSLAGPYTLDQYDGGNACPVGESCPDTAAQCVYYPVAGPGDGGWTTRCASGATASQTMTTGDNANGAYGAYCLFLGRSDQSARTMVVSIIPLDDQSTGNYEWVPREPNAEVCTANRSWSAGVAVKLTINVSNDGVGAAPVRFNIDSMILVFAVPPATGTATATAPTATASPTAGGTGVERTCGLLQNCDMDGTPGSQDHWANGNGCVSQGYDIGVNCSNYVPYQDFTADRSGELCLTATLPGVPPAYQSAPNFPVWKSGFGYGSYSSFGVLTLIQVFPGGQSQYKGCAGGTSAGDQYNLALSVTGFLGSIRLDLLDVEAFPPTATPTGPTSTVTDTGTPTPSVTPHEAGTQGPSATATLIPRPTSTFTGTTTVDCGLLCDCMIVAAQIIAGGEVGIADATTNVANAANTVADAQQRLATSAAGWSTTISNGASAVAQGESDAATIGGTYVLSGTSALGSSINAAGGNIGNAILPIGPSVITATDTLAASVDTGFNAVNTGLTQAGGIVGTSLLTATSQINDSLSADWLGGTAAISNTGIVVSAAVRGAGDSVAASIITGTGGLAGLGGIADSLDGVTVAVAGLVTVTQHLSDRIDLAGPWLDQHLIGDSTTGIDGLGNSTHDIADQIQSAFMVGDCSSLLPTCVSEFSAFNTELAAGGTVALTEIGTGEAAIGAEIAVVDTAVVAGNTEAVAAAGVFGVDFAALAGGVGKLAGIVPCGTTVGGVQVDSPVCNTGDAIDHLRQDFEQAPSGITSSIVPDDPAADIAPMATAVARDVPNFHDIHGSVAAAPCATVTIYGGKFDLCHGYYEDNLREPVYNFQLAMLGLGVAFLVVGKFRGSMSRREQG